jgi:hypothetical protein
VHVTNAGRRPFGLPLTSQIDAIAATNIESPALAHLRLGKRAVSHN